ncbi:four-helix bundle copper-binding protein [Leptospira yasudae]|uniref:Four-helix bundle copper-binding protein n=1 Tax=Leptospira yasudae TaxID=2202201 RepID=A0A6N4QQF1_9LEPT|nr:four-helix bundle copper-binding protein [Leptospira yasudae]TGL74538.1 four-helix bundle copper-binding protein [Leptospira yasudae]TGL76193.1 four-helix bundle copper-binding protein [Leptospira yasudae]TGL79344.1 four-helix bundle copper-binding protein [Leptospira yasudae]
MLTRKELITQSAALLAFASAGSLLAKESSHKHHEAPAKKNDKPTSKKVDRKTLEAANKCILNAEICLAHCEENLSTGDTMLGDCLKTVKDTLALCKAFVSLGASNSPLTKEVAAICIKACETCEKECRVHESHHEICKNCADSCKECIAELKKVA